MNPNVPRIDFKLTPSQWKALQPIVEAANRADGGFCVIAQIKLGGAHGFYGSAEARCRIVDRDAYMIVKRALVRAKVSKPAELLP